MSNIIEQSFGLHIRIMDFLGLYPSKTHPKFQKIKAYSLYLTLMVGVEILVIINILCKESSDTVQANIMVIYVAETTCMCFKCIKLITYSQQIQKCIEYFGHPRFAPRNDEERRIVNDCIHVCRRNSFIWVCILSCAYFGGISVSLLTEDYQLPLDVWVPYDPRSGPVVFYLTFIFTAAVILYITCSGVLVDALIGGLAYQATAQLKILKYNLQHLATLGQLETCKNRDEHSTINFQETCTFLERCVNHHNYILNFIDEYQDCFSFCVFCQIVGCTFAICYSCIGLILAPSTSFKAANFVTYFWVFSAEILFYCYYGTLLLEENDDFINAIYMGPWYTYDVKIRKHLILMMERSKRPIILTAGKIVNLTLQTFTSLLKTSYSLIAVLHKTGGK